MSEQHKSASAARNMERKLLDDIIAEIRRSREEAPRMAYGVEIPKDRATQFLLRYKRVTKP